MALSRIDTTNMIEDVPQSKLDNNINFRNIIINGDMSIAQRGTSTSGVTTSDGYYACDRFYTQTDTGTWTISQSTDTPSGQGFSKSLKLDCTSAGTSNADEVGIRHKVEGQNVQYLKYGTSSADSLTLSFWIKTNLTGTYTVAFKNVSSVQERIVSFEYTVSSANTWEKKTITLPGDTSQALENTNNSEFEIYWYFSAAFGTGVTNTWQNYSSGFLSSGSLPGLGGSTSDEVYITGVQLEAGTSASDFEFLPHDVNLQRCQRYYFKTTESGTATILLTGGLESSTSAGQGGFSLPTEMRATPSLSFGSGIRFYSVGSGTRTPSISENRCTTTVLSCATAVSGGTSGQAGYIYRGTSDGFLVGDAEL